jgi:DNA-binding MarR family transcriptional regulator
MNEELSAEDYKALHEFRYAIRRFLRFSDDAARAAGIEPQQHQLMLAIKGTANTGEARVTDLAERLQVRHHSTVELIDRLVAGGYAERHRGTTDRRQVFVRLTDQGEALLRQLSITHRTVLRTGGPALVVALQAIIDERPENAARVQAQRESEGRPAEPGSAQAPSTSDSESLPVSTSR